MAASTPNQLPALRTVPLEKGGASSGMRAGERRLLDDVAGSSDWFLLLKTHTRVDVGEWLRNGRVWLCATGSELVLLAAGRAPFVQKVPFEHLQGSLYNHITGEIVLSPAKEMKVKRVRLTALDGYQLLAQIHGMSPGGQNKEIHKHA